MYDSITSNIYCRYFAKDDYIHPDTTTPLNLLISDSHGAGILGARSKKLRKLIRNGNVIISFLIYPGYTLSDGKQWHEIKSDLEVVCKEHKIDNLFVHFGSNDASRAASFLSPEDGSLDDAILHGNNKDAVSGSIMDPLSIMHLFTESMRQEYDSAYHNYFLRLDKLAGLCSPQHMTVASIVGRFLKGVDHRLHLPYNRAAYYFRNQLYVESNGDGKVKTNYSILDPFCEMWCDGSANLLQHHKSKEVLHVLLQDLYYTKYGGVHYNDSVYAQLLGGIVRELIPRD